MKLSDPEKTAISKLLLDIIYADGKVTVSETTFYMHLQNKLGISNQLMENSRKLNISICYSIINDMNKNQKDYVSDLIHQMIVADGHVNDEEIKVYNKFCEAAGFSVNNNEKAG